LSGLERSFDKYARKGAYHWRDYHGGLLRLNAYTRARYDAVVRALRDHGIGRGARVLDLGCGDGALAGVLVRRLGVRVCGVDTEPLAIALARAEFARRALSGDFHLAQGYDIGVDEQFDAVVCSDVLEHVQAPESMLNEIRRALRAQGVAVLTTPIRFTERPLDPQHVQEWFPSEFARLCEAAFGKVLAHRQSHPSFWYEAYNLGHPLFGRAARFLINMMSRLGINPFLDLAGGWRCYTTQLVVLRKPA
jgi:2-polyprenyl-3-methyl-5-hydroxy-6-metoxy-1,4-benzoquinol methylase